MPRDVHGHEVEGESVKVFVQALDTPLDGASHLYDFLRQDGARVGQIVLHYGEISEINDVNGITPEALISALIDHVSGLKSGEFGHKQLGLCCKRLEEALKCLQLITKERLEEKPENLVEAK